MQLSKGGFWFWKLERCALRKVEAMLQRNRKNDVRPRRKEKS